MDKKALNDARMLYYDLFSKLFIFNFNHSRYEGVENALTCIYSNPLDNSSFDSTKELLQSIKLNSFERIQNEFEEIFHNPQTKHLGHSASYYENGVEFTQKCVDVKNLLAKTNIRKDENTYKDPEDSVGFLFRFMVELIKGRQNDKKVYEDVEFMLFKNVINEFIDEFIKELFLHPSAKEYKDVAIILNSFMEFERLYFDVQKVPTKQIKREYDISISESLRRAANKARKNADKIKKGEKNGA